MFHKHFCILCKINPFRELCFHRMQHFLCQIQKKFYFTSIFPNDHGIVRHIIFIRGIIVLFQFLRSAIPFVPCNTFMPVRCHCLQTAQLQYMSCFAILLAIDHIYFKLTVFHRVFIILLTEYIKDKIQPCKQKSRKHKCLGNRDSHNHKKHCKNNHYHTQDSGHTLFLS